MDKEILTRVESYLSFRIGEEQFGAHVSQVLNILELQNITKIPNAPEYMIGVINLRGVVLPIIDTRIKFGMSPTEFTDDTCIIVMDLKIEGQAIKLGTLVDSVEAVLEIDEEQIKPTPEIGNINYAEFISGVVEHKNNFIMLLDAVKLFTSSKLEKNK